MRIRLAMPPKSMWIPVAIIVLVLAVGYGWASRYPTTAGYVDKAKSMLGLGVG